jgi:hypothetical protein
VSSRGKPKFRKRFGENRVVLEREFGTKFPYRWEIGTDPWEGKDENPTAKTLEEIGNVVISSNQEKYPYSGIRGDVEPEFPVARLRQENLQKEGD